MRLEARHLIDKQGLLASKTLQESYLKSVSSMWLTKMSAAVSSSWGIAQSLPAAKATGHFMGITN
jgi:hypothetical protein